MPLVPQNGKLGLGDAPAPTNGKPLGIRIRSQCGDGEYELNSFADAERCQELDSSAWIIIDIDTLLAAAADERRNVWAYFDGRPGGVQYASGEGAGTDLLAAALAAELRDKSPAGLTRRRDALVEIGQRLRGTAQIDPLAMAGPIAETLRKLGMPGMNTRSIAAAIRVRHHDDQVEQTTADVQAAHVGPGEIPDLRAPVGQTDLAYAQRFIAQHADKILYEPARKKWLVWDGSRWRPDDIAMIDGLARETASETARQIAQAVMAKADGAGERAGALWRYVKACTSARGIKDMLQLAGGMVAISPKALDADPYLLGCANGVIDLRTGELLPADPVRLMTMSTGVSYDPAAASPLWEQAVRTILSDDAEMVSYAQRLLGSALIGVVREHLLSIFHGSGANGQDVLLGCVLDALGDYAVVASQELLMSKKQAGHDSLRCDLVGRRLVVVSETDAERKLDEAAIKLLTGGGRLRVRWLYSATGEQIEPTWLVVVMTNHKPRVSGTDHSIWRRLQLIPFLRRFWRPGIDAHGIAELQANPELRQKLRGELPGVLNWLVTGCRAYQQDGLRPPQSILDASTEYRREEDWMGEFLATTMTPAEGASVPQTRVHALLVAWCRTRDFGAPSNRALGHYLREHDYPRQHMRDGAHIVGYRVVAPGTSIPTYGCPTV